MASRLTSIREVERGIARFQQEGPARVPDLERPSGTPADYAEHSRLMYNMQALAFQADLTRVITMMVGRESSIRSYDQIGIPESHHQLSHHRNDRAALAKLTRIQTYHLGFFADLKCLVVHDGQAVVRGAGDPVQAQFRGNSRLISSRNHHNGGIRPH